MMITRVTMGGPWSRRPLLVAVLGVLGAVAGNPSAAQDGPRADPERAAEARYHKLTSARNIGAKDWLLIADWCRTVAGDVPPRSSDVFRQRAAESVKRARLVITDTLDGILGRARRDVREAATYARAKRLRDLAAQKANDYLDEVIPFIKDESTIVEFSTRVRAAIEGLDAVVEPLARAEERARVAASLMPIDGEWVDFKTAHDEYGGFVALEELLADPAEHTGRRVGTELTSTLQVFYLLDSVLLDGFDKKGKYIAPNFVEDHLVIALPAEIQQGLLDLSGVKQSETTDADALPHFRARVVLEIRRDTQQFTTYFEGSVHSMAVFGGDGALIGVIGAGENR